MEFKKVFAYRTKCAAYGGPALHFFEEGSPDSALPIAILPEATTEKSARHALYALGCEITEWEAL